MADFLKSLPKLCSLTSFWRCSRKLFLLACQAVCDVLMQVSSQTCSCAAKDSPREGNGVGRGVWNKPRISSSPSDFFLICPHSQLSSTQTQQSQTQPSFPGISPPTTERLVCPPHIHLCVKPNTHHSISHAHILNWPAVWVVRATNILQTEQATVFWQLFKPHRSLHWNCAW